MMVKLQDIYYLKMDGKIISNKLVYFYNYNLNIKNYLVKDELIQLLLLYQEKGLNLNELFINIENQVLQGSILTNIGIYNILSKHKKITIEILKEKEVEKWINQQS